MYFLNKKNWFCIFWRATQILCVWIVLDIYHNFYGCLYNIDHTTLCYSTLYEHVAFPFLHTYVTVLVVHIYTTSFAIVYTHIDVGFLYTCWLSVICLPPPCGFSILDQWSFYLVFSIDYTVSILIRHMSSRSYWTLAIIC